MMLGNCKPLVNILLFLNEMENISKVTNPDGLPTILVVRSGANGLVSSVKPWKELNQSCCKQWDMCLKIVILDEFRGEGGNFHI